MLAENKHILLTQQNFNIPVFSNLRQLNLLRSRRDSKEVFRIICPFNFHSAVDISITKLYFTKKYDLCRFLPLLNSILSSNKRCLYSSKNPHKVSLKQCLMNRPSPVSVNMLVTCPRLPCSRKQQLLFLKDWRLAASEMNANNYRVHQMK